MRDRYDEIRQRGAELVAIGTGDARYARAFVEDERIPFPVLVDDDGEAARAAGVTRASPLRLFHPASWAPTVRAFSRGHLIARPGKRVDQLGATFVIAPGNEVRLGHLDEHPADHASFASITAALER